MNAELFGSLGGVFLAGLSMGTTICVAHCSPVMFFVGGTAEGWKDGLKYVLLFSLGRLFSLTLLGALAGGIGSYILTYLAESSLVEWVQYAAAALVVILGVGVLAGRSHSISSTRICRAFIKRAPRGSSVSMVLLGLLIGITPFCPVFLGLLNYIAFGLESSMLGALFAFTFGLGSAVITPLLGVGPLVGWASRLFSSPLRLKIFRRSAGAILVVLGISLGLGI
ncbi:MAG: sulfite exporter TauE/SafE family protein [Spirochaetales bacterium]